MESFEILNNHAPIISTLTNGEIKVTTNDKNKKYLKLMVGLLKCKTIRLLFWQINFYWIKTKEDLNRSSLTNEKIPDFINIFLFLMQ